MKKPMESLQDLIEEAKLRLVWWALCIFGVTYFLTHTSKSMLMNLPVAVLLISGLRMLVSELEFKWKIHSSRPTSYLSHLEQKQLPVNDSRLSAPPPLKKWKRKIDSPVVEAAMEDFINKLLHDFVINLWYSDITPDKEGPEIIRCLIMDAIGEVSGRVKELNLVDLLTRDVVELIGDHLDLFRRNQAVIGMDVMRTLSFEERDERLKHHLIASKELHPALISPECEHKVLQQLMDGLLAVVLTPQEAQCSVVRCIARELLTSLVIQPIMNFASPGYINELIECIVLAYHNEEFKDVTSNQSSGVEGHNIDHRVAGEHDSVREASLTKGTISGNLGTDMSASHVNHEREPESDGSGFPLSEKISHDLMHPRPSEWAKVFEAASQRRTEVLMPENLENMWTIGRNYKKELEKKAASGEHIDTSAVSLESRNKLKKSNSTSDLKVQSTIKDIFNSGGSGPIITEYCAADDNKRKIHSAKSSSDRLLHSEEIHVPKLRCRVIGAYFEKIGSNSFAVYSIAVTDGDNTTWFVKRRYRNFERLHRHLKDIPNYALHLPPKRIFSSSTEDAFVHQRCVQLDKYLQDLFSFANVAEQHEVWDFLSDSSKNYSFGKSSSVMKTLAVNVDDAVDDILRQFKGVSDGLMQKLIGSTSYSEPADSVTSRNLSWNSDNLHKLGTRQSITESMNSNSDDEDSNKFVSHGQQEVEASAEANGWHSDNELNSNGFPPRVVKHNDGGNGLTSEGLRNLSVKTESRSLTRYQEPNLALTCVSQEDPVGVPPEWTPPNLSVPILNLVDNIFQLKRRGWLRRQVFWISKQILQLIMEDAIDDWILRQIQWLRKEEVVAQGIRWIQDVLWPDGTFFLRLRTQSPVHDSQANQESFQSTSKHVQRRVTKPGSFEYQLEAARRASDVKKMIFDGAPATLVSLIGHKQYRRCSRDLYYFLQSTICLKQLGYGILELVLISLCPELRKVVVNMHEKMHAQAA